MDSDNIVLNFQVVSHDLRIVISVEDPTQPLKAISETLHDFVGLKYINTKSSKARLVFQYKGRYLEMKKSFYENGLDLKMPDDEYISVFYTTQFG